MRGAISSGSSLLGVMPDGRNEEDKPCAISVSAVIRKCARTSFFEPGVEEG